MTRRTEEFGFGVTYRVSRVRDKSGISCGMVKSFIKLVLDLSGDLSIIEHVFLPFLSLILLVKDRYVKT